MSTPSKSKPSTKPVTKAAEPKPKYSMGQKVFIIDRGRSYPGFILQGRVEQVRTTKGWRTQAEPNSKVKMVQHTTFEYDLSTPGGYFERMSECILFNTISAASLDFTEPYTTLLK